MVERSIRITCDRCDKVRDFGYGSEVDNATDAREILYREGWVRSNVVDACPNCRADGDRGRDPVPVLRYSPKGEFIAKFDSVTLAAEEAGVSVGSIYQGIRESRVTGGYVYVYEGEEFTLPKSSNNTVGRKGKDIICYPLDPEQPKQTFRSAVAAARELGMPVGVIYQAIYHKRPANGYKFMYDE